MEFEDVSEKIEWEARRVAASFGVETFTYSHSKVTLLDFYAFQGDIALWWALDSRPEKTTIRVLDIKSGVQRCQVGLADVLGNSQQEDRWILVDQGVLSEEMARWLYRLGFEDEEVLSRLPTLTMHEQMEARLSMPREFWPQKWLDEEAK